MPICYLHVGSHKTGTTAIQDFLARNRAVFDRNNILVPASGTTSRGSHIVLVHRMLGMPVASHHQDPLAALKAEMQAHPSHHLLISAELLEITLKHGPRRHPIVEFFSKAGYEVRIILYVRNAPQLTNARYSQRVKMFRYDGEFSEMLQRIMAKDHGLSRWVDVVRDNPCSLIARAYTGQVQAGGLIEDLMQVLGFDWRQVSSQFAVAARLNESVGPTAIAAARRIMSQGADRLNGTDRNIKSWCGRKLLDEVKSQGIREPKFSGFDRESARRLLQHQRAANDLFAQEFWQKSWDEVFAADVSEEFVVNDFAQIGMTEADRKRVDRLYHSLWSRIERKLKTLQRT